MYARKMGPFIAPSITKGATIPSWRKPATNVIVFQCPCGTDAISRSPRGQRPLTRTMFVLVAVSSINTSRAGSSMPCSRIQRRRARATSARFCSAACRLFFEADRVPLEEAPHRAAAAGDPSLAHRRDDLIQRQIRSVGNQHQQKVRVCLQGRDAASARLGGYTSGFLLPVHPFDGRTWTHCEPFRGLASRCAGLDGLHYSLAQLQRTWL